MKTNQLNVPGRRRDGRGLVTIKAKTFREAWLKTLPSVMGGSQPLLPSPCSLLSLRSALAPPFPVSAAPGQICCPPFMTAINLLPPRTNLKVKVPLIDGEGESKDIWRTPVLLGTGPVLILAAEEQLFFRQHCLSGADESAPAWCVVTRAPRSTAACHLCSIRVWPKTWSGKFCGQRWTAALSASVRLWKGAHAERWCNKRISTGVLLEKKCTSIVWERH